ncbi:NADPH:quinone reductase [Aestuariivita boseongensis]|uniref:NADPH:quinone reductase n=1 Tax=Aestuariivita boseongensis TaxID=1470562 RepID=UPI000680C3AB|nr:NADPH:quinone reductase [Aestuariivita boseongensis]
MKAITYDSFGAATDVLTLADIESPDPGPGEVRVALAFSGVNPSDVKARAGARPGVTKPPFPVIIPHSDGSGVIDAVGDGVSKDRIGERVWIWNGQWQRAFGTCAEEITLPSDQAVKLPDGADLKTGAVLGIPGLTACYTIFNGAPISGKTVLFQGAAGTVGFLAVQLALWGGAKVIATARGEGARRVRDLGVEHVFDFTSPDLVAEVLDANGGHMVDRIIEPEFGLNIAVNTEMIAPNGTICAYGSALEPAPVMPFMPLMFKAVTLDLALVYILTTEQRANMVRTLNEAVQTGALHCPIEAVFSLEQTAQAHQAVEAGKRAGAVLVETGTF